jgi:hypothetical protein
MYGMRSQAAFDDSALLLTTAARPAPLPFALSLSRDERQDHGTKRSRYLTFQAPYSRSWLDKLTANPKDGAYNR